MWTIEVIDEDNYGIVLTHGRNSKTIYYANSSKSADDLVEALEFWELFKAGVPHELVKPKPKPRTTTRKKPP